MREQQHIYYHNDKVLHGYMAYEEEPNQQRPAILIAHDWSGRGEFVAEKARLLAKMGYLGFAVDMYGEGQVATSLEEKKALMNPLISNRALLQERMKTAYETVRMLPQVDASQIAVIGFCFGGLCALDLARSGIDIKGAVSFHGLLNKPNGPEQAIKAKILVLHGYNDPMVPPDNVHAFADEMTQAKVDWQVHMYGQVKHAFTNPQAHDEELGLMYNKVAAQRAWQAMSHFFLELFENSGDRL